MNNIYRHNYLTRAPVGILQDNQHILRDGSLKPIILTLVSKDSNFSDHHDSEDNVKIFF